MNVFEGARRISMVIAAAGVLISAIVAHNDKPYIAIPFQIRNIDLPPVQADGCKPFDTDVLESVTRWTPQGEKFTADICFTASVAQDGRMLVPFQSKDGPFLMGPNNSDQVREYTSFIAQRFAVPEGGNDAVNNAIEHQKSMHYVRSLGFLALGLFIFWIFVSIIGWIVRGFAGIPTGRDTKAS